MYHVLGGEGNPQAPVRPDRVPARAVQHWTVAGACDVHLRHHGDEFLPGFGAGSRAG